MTEEELKNAETEIAKKISSFFSEEKQTVEEDNDEKEKFTSYIYDTYFPNKNDDFLKSNIRKKLEDNINNLFNFLDTKRSDSLNYREKKQGFISKIAKNLLSITFNEDLTSTASREKQETTFTSIPLDKDKNSQEELLQDDSSLQTENINISGLAMYIEMSTIDNPNDLALRISYDATIVNGLMAEKPNLEFDINLDKDFGSYMSENDNVNSETLRELNNHNGTLIFNSEESLQQYQDYLSHFNIEAKAKTVLNIEGTLEKHPSQNELDFNLNPVAVLESFKKPQPVHQRNKPLSEKSTNLPVPPNDPNLAKTQRRSNTKGKPLKT